MWPAIIPPTCQNIKWFRTSSPAGRFLINCAYDNAEELGKHLPDDAKRYIADNNIKVYTIDAISDGREIGLGNKTNSILQAAFFKLANILPIDDAVKYMKEAIVATYGNKGENIVKMNLDAVDAGLEKLNAIEVPAEWKNASSSPVETEVKGDREEVVKYVKDVLIPVNAMQGDKLPVSAFWTPPPGSAPAPPPMKSAASQWRCPGGFRKLHPVQPVLLRLPSRRHPSLCV